MPHVEARFNKIESLLIPPPDSDEDAAAAPEVAALEVPNKPKQIQSLEAKIVEMEEHYRQEIARRDRDITSLQLRLKHNKSLKGSNLETKSLDAYVNIQLSNTNKAHEDAIAALKEQHNKALGRHQEILQEQLDEKWQVKLEMEERRIQDNAAKLRKEEESHKKARVANRNLLQGKYRKHNTDIQALYNLQKDGTLALAKETQVPSQQACLDGLSSLWDA